MFQLALRMWTGEQMIYPVKFSVMYNPEKRVSSVRAFIKNDKFISSDYMLITPFVAINGEIFEKDIVVIDNDFSILRIVEFRPDLGQYIAKAVNNDDYLVMDCSHRYEIAGNIYEDKDLLSEETVNNVDNVDDSPNKEEQIPEEIQIDDQIEKNPTIEAHTEDIIDDSIQEKEDVIAEEEVNIIKNVSDEKVNIDIHFFSVCNNSGKGGYSFTFDADNTKDTYKGSEDGTSEKRVSLSGIIAALEMLEGDFQVRIFTNSQYVVYPFVKGWIYKWHDANWTKDDNEKVQNYELWSQLFEYAQKYNIKWEFVSEPTEDMKECEKFAKEEIS